MVETVGKTKPRDPSEEPSLDLVFEILQNERRREVLRYIQREEDSTIRDVSEQLAAIENDKEVTALGSQERKRVYISLYQSHLPRMDDAGAILYDRDRGTISLGEHTELFTSVLANSQVTHEEKDDIRSVSVIGMTGALVVGMLLAAVIIEVGSLVVFGVIVGLVLMVALTYHLV